MFKIELTYWEDLTEEEKKGQPSNGVGKECANYIRLSDAGKTVMILSDAMEPEDATFTRDLSKVIDALTLVYKEGFKAGKKCIN